MGLGVRVGGSCRAPPSPPPVRGGVRARVGVGVGLRVRVRVRVRVSVSVRVRVRVRVRAGACVKPPPAWAPACASSQPAWLDIMVRVRAGFYGYG